MNSKEFAYWLQGWFENNEAAGLTVTDLTPRQFELVALCITKHLKLALEVDKTPSRFVVWLEGYLESSEGEWQSRHFIRIKDRLAEEFVHVIDPSYPGDQIVLQSIHDTGKKPEVLASGAVVKLPEPTADQRAYLNKILSESKVTPEQLAATMIRATFNKRAPSQHPLSFQFVNGVKMGYDGETPDRGVHFDTNSEEYVPGARC